MMSAGQSKRADVPGRGAYAGRAARVDDLGTTSEVRVHNRHSNLLGLRWCRAGCSCIEDPDVIKKIFSHLGEKAVESAGSQRPPVRAPPPVHGESLFKLPRVTGLAPRQ